MGYWYQEKREPPVRFHGNKRFIDEMMSLLDDWLSDELYDVPDVGIMTDGNTMKVIRNGVTTTIKLITEEYFLGDDDDFKFTYDCKDKNLKEILDRLTKSITKRFWEETYKKYFYTPFENDGHFDE